MRTLELNMPQKFMLYQLELSTVRVIHQGNAKDAKSVELYNTESALFPQNLTAGGRQHLDC